MKKNLSFVIGALAIVAGFVDALHAADWKNIGLINATSSTEGHLCFNVSSSTPYFDCSNDAPYLDVGTGNVGIGTTSPSSTLHVQGSVPAFTLSDSFNGSWTQGQNVGTLSFKTNDTSSTPSELVRIAVINDRTGTVSFPSGAVAFSTGEAGGALTEKVRISSAGNVGIGTTSPQTALEVSGTISATDLYVNGTQITAGGSVWSQSGTDVYRSSGNVGIGATAPTASLDVSATKSTDALRLRSGDTAAAPNGGQQLIMSFNGTADYSHAIKTRHNSGSQAGNAMDFYLWNRGVDTINSDPTKHVMTLEGTGNVGIGTTAPSATLHVAGTISTTSNVDVSGTIKVSGSAGDACNASTLGTFRRNPTTGHLEVCYDM